MPDNGSPKARSCPEPGRMYHGFERKSLSQTAPTQQAYSRSLPQTRPKSLLSMLLAPKILQDDLANDSESVEDDDSEEYDSLNPSACGSLSSDEQRRELLELESRSNASGPSVAGESVCNSGEGDLVLDTESSYSSCTYLPRDVSISAPLEIPSG